MDKFLRAGVDAGHVSFYLRQLVLLLLPPKSRSTHLDSICPWPTPPAFETAGLPAQVTGLGLLFAVHLTSQPVKSYRDTMGVDADLRYRIFLSLFKEGVLIDPRGVESVSVAIEEAEIDQFVDAVRTVLRTLGGS